MLDSGETGTKAELANKLGVSRAKVTQVLNLLKLDEACKRFILALDEKDERLKLLTERRLRQLTQIKDSGRHKNEVWKILRIEN